MKIRIMIVSLLMLSIGVPANAQWDQVAQCESENGRTSGNIYQFTPDTWDKVAPPGAANPEDATPSQQLEAAKEWASRINPGSTAGWPNCWPKGYGQTESKATSQVNSQKPLSPVNVATPTQSKVGLTG